MRGLQEPIVGREAELTAVHTFLDEITDGAASLVLEGVAGIGKTAIFNRALAEARGRR